MSKEDIRDLRFAAIDDVCNFNRLGHGPFLTQVQVRANAHPSTNYPQTRIYLGAWEEKIEEGAADFGGLSLTVQQACDLVKALNKAIGVVVKNCPTLMAPVVEDLT